MPKMNSTSAASKPVRRTGTGKLMQPGRAMSYNHEH